MNGKTPYEIRLETLKLAYDILLQEYAAKDVREQIENGKTEIFPTSQAPSIKDVIKAAGDLNEFISKNKLQ